MKQNTGDQKAIMTGRPIGTTYHCDEKRTDDAAAIQKVDAPSDSRTGSLSLEEDMTFQNALYMIPNVGLALALLFFWCAPPFPWEFRLLCKLGMYPGLHQRERDEPQAQVRIGLMASKMAMTSFKANGLEVLRSRCLI